MPELRVPQPAADAAVVRIGLRRLWQMLPGFLICTAVGVAGVVALVRLVIATLRGEFSAPMLFATLLLLAFGVFAVLMGAVWWKTRSSTIAVDGLGVWLDTGVGRQVVPWTELHQVGIWRSPAVRRRSSRLYSLELVPAGPVAGTDPVLWALIRDETSPGPGPRGPRYRMPFPGNCRGQVTDAVRRYCPPQVWAGLEDRPTGHMGRPDPGLRPTD